MNQPLQLFTEPAPSAAPQRSPRPRPAPADTLTDLTRSSRCPTCHRGVLEALTGPVLAFHVLLDPIDVTDPHAELALIVDGRPTYTATSQQAPPGKQPRYRISYRDSSTHAHETCRPVVLALHACQRPPAGQRIRRTPRPPSDVTVAPF